MTNDFLVKLNPNPQFYFQIFVLSFLFLDVLPAVIISALPVVLR